MRYCDVDTDDMMFSRCNSCDQLDAAIMMQLTKRDVGVNFLSLLISIRDLVGSVIVYHYRRPRSITIHV